MAKSKLKTDRLYFGFLAEIEFPGARKYLDKLTLDSDGFITYHKSDRYATAPVRDLDWWSKVPSAATRNAAILEQFYRYVREHAAEFAAEHIDSVLL